MRLRPLAFAALLAGCGGSSSTPPPPPAPPSVLVLPHASYVIDTHFTVDVSVSGCDAVTNVQLADGPRLLGSADSPPSSPVTFDIGKTQVDYHSAGIAAHLQLVATATCKNGASAASQAVGMAFLPADTVFPGSFAVSPLVLDTSAAGLFACQGSSVARLDLNGNTLQTSGSGLGFNCTAHGYPVRAGPNEIYWVEPGAGVARIDPASGGGTLVTLSSTAWNAGRIYFPPNGANPAVFFDAAGQSMLWLDRSNGQVLASGLPLAGLLDGEPGMGSTGLLVPEEKSDLSGTTVDLQVERFSPATGASAGATILANTAVGSLGTANVPALNLSPSGTSAYFVAGDTHQDIWACDSDKPCTDRSQGGGLIFKVTLPNGPYAIAQPVGSSVVAAGPGLVQFLDTSGTRVGNPITPTGNLSVYGIYPGAGSQFYVSSGDAAGNNTLELVLLSAPGAEAARVTLNTGALGWDLDDSGRPYVLVNGKLARLLTPDQYAAARQ